MVKNPPPANVGDAASMPGSGRYPAEGNGNSLQYSCLGNPINRGDRQATVHEFTKELDTLFLVTKQQQQCPLKHYLQSQYMKTT